MSPSFFVAVLLAACALAAPSQTSCDPSKAQLVLPANQSALATPSAPLSFVLLGVGTQNYTCSDAGTYASAGAVAQLFDISCLANTDRFDTIQDVAYAAWTAAPVKSKCRTDSEHLTKAIGKLPPAGHHYFGPSPSGTGISPIWDMRSSGPASLNGNPNAFVLAAKVANLSAPTGAKDVDWLQLKNVQGGLATAIYRTDTRGGPAPASCQPGSAPITVKYTSKYWLFGSSV